MPDARGIAVVDAGATNWKVLLFARNGRLLARRRMARRWLAGAPYPAIDVDALIDFARAALAELSGLMPVDDIVPCAHGSALALLGEDGAPVLPVMIYEADPPARIKAEYAAIEPPYGEVFAPTNPAGLTLGRQLLWQESEFADAFARVRTIVPLGQYVAFRLGGRPVSEVSALGAQTHLWDVRADRFSSLALSRGWDRLFAPLSPAWHVVGEADGELRTRGLAGAGRVRTGIHDSNANYLRCLAAGLNAFTLLSTGTWIIGFDSKAEVAALDPRFDLVSNTDIFGRPVACCRFMGGREAEIVAAGAEPSEASLAAVAALVAEGVVALPSFTDSGGPAPGTGGRGRIDASRPLSRSERASLAGLYAAMMTCLSLDAVGSRHTLVVDGPFAAHPVFAGLLAALRPGQPVRIADQGEGTAAGAALLARFDDGCPPRAELALQAVEPAGIAGLGRYFARWREDVRGGFAG